MKKTTQNLLIKNKKRGATLIEYGMLGGLIALAGIGGVILVGERTERTFCEASTSIGRVIYSDPDLACDPNNRMISGYPLSENEHLSDAEITTQPDFEDVLFPYATIGEQAVMVALNEDLVEDLTLTASISSQNPYEPNRIISACFEISNANGLVCSTPGASSSINVPVGATAIGYQVDVQHNTDMPWENSVNIQIPEGPQTTAQNHTVSVDREEAPLLLADVDLTLENISFPQNITNWQYGTFAPIEGEYNRTLQYTVSRNGSPVYYYRSCYTQSEGDTPICGTAATSTGSTVQVPAGAFELGYMVQLPDEDIKPDWVGQLDYALGHDGLSIVDKTVSITRTNADHETGSLDGFFAATYTYQQTDEGWTYAEFIPINGPRNVPVVLTMSRSDATSPLRTMCYTVIEGGPKTCGALANSTDSSISVPTNAVEIGYQFQLPEPGVGPDWETTQTITLSYDGAEIATQEITATRPNANYETGSVDAFFSENYTYEGTDEGWTYGEFIPINGPRNVPLVLTISRSNATNPLRRVCYTVVEGGSKTCGALANTTDAAISVPANAVEIGYQFQLPEPEIGPNWQTIQTISLSHNGTSLYSEEITVERDNPDYQIGSVTDSFASAWTFTEAQDGYQFGEFIAINGPRNDYIRLVLSRTSGDHRNRRACYRTSIGGSETCGNWRSSVLGDVAVDVPPEAVEIGYQYSLPTTEAGPDWVLGETISLQHTPSSTYLLNNNVTITKQNPDYQYGGVSGSFTSPFNYNGQDYAGYVEAELLSLTGTRNVDVTLTITKDNSAINGNYRQACYTTEVDGTWTCGTGRSGNNVASVTVPPEAVQIGYRMYWHTNNTGYSTIQDFALKYGSTVIWQQENVNITRPAY